MVAEGFLQERQGVYLCRKCLADDCKLFEEMLNSGRLVCVTTRFSISGRVSCGIMTSH